jgi:exo-beta-1,3-glucanase (GH17 family)
MGLTAVTASKNYPGTVQEIFVGNENIPPVGPYSVSALIQHINDVKTQGATVPVGTVQRINEWLQRTGEIVTLLAHQADS